VFWVTSCLGLLEKVLSDYLLKLLRPAVHNLTNYNRFCVYFDLNFFHFYVQTIFLGSAIFGFYFTYGVTGS